MEITVITEEENPMLHRTDVRFRVSHAEATPDRLAVRDSLAARLNKSADEVVIRRLDTKFGMRETLGEAKVYQGPEFAVDVEQEHMLARNKIGEHGEADAADVADEAAEADEEAAEPEADEEAAGDADIEDEAAESDVEEPLESDTAESEEPADGDESEEASGEEPEAEDAADAADGDEETEA